MTDPEPISAPISMPAARALRSLYLQARHGQIPAEALPTNLRWRLVADLHAHGWTDVDIALQTFMTTYTAARIREAMQLPPNRPRVVGEMSA